MFGLGFMEILFIVIIAIIFLGPDKLPKAMVDIAKFIKGAKNAISDAKESLNEELDIEELKREALSYKSKLDEATEELQGFKNLNPVNEVKKEFGSVKENFAALTQLEEKPIATPVEPKQKEKEITFKKKTVTESSIKEEKESTKK
jgi:sec-independent protein translocase protein TatB